MSLVVQLFDSGVNGKKNWWDILETEKGGKKSMMEL